MNGQLTMCALAKRTYLCITLSSSLYSMLSLAIWVRAQADSNRACMACKQLSAVDFGSWIVGLHIASTHIPRVEYTNFSTHF